MLLKTGICRIDELPEARSCWGRPRRVSLNLLSAAATALEPDDLFSKVTASLRLSNGTYKATNRHRFSRFDPLVNRSIAHLLGGRADICVHDWATSDGSAALEWARSLRSVAERLEFCASDQMLTSIKAYRSNREAYFFELNGQPMQYTRPPFVISLQEPESATYPVNRCLARWALHNAKWLSKIVPTLRWSSILDATVVRTGSWCFSQMPLVHPAVLAFASENPWFQLTTHSIFEPLAEPADVIRSMNIMNHAYFDREHLISGIRTCYNSLRRSGIWIVGRSQLDAGAETDADLFQKDSGGFRVVATTGNGSEIRDLVTGLQFA